MARVAGSTAPRISAFAILIGRATCMCVAFLRAEMVFIRVPLVDE